MPSFCVICALWRLLLRPAAQISAVTVSAVPAGCTASQRRPCTVPRYTHDNGALSICHTEAAERTEQNTLSKTRRNSQTPQKRLKTLKNAISRRSPTENTPPEREAAPTGPGTATNVEPRDVYQDTSSRPTLPRSQSYARKSPKSLIVAKSIVAG